MDIHFNCTQCGVCCRNIKIPLTVLEAVDWLNDGNQVQLICEAAPWPKEPTDDPKAAHFKRRSFAAASGAMPTRIVAMLVANLPGDCPNLMPDMRCGIYDRRPLVCRIYPAEINPTVELQPEKKACPPEAWAPVHPRLMRDGKLAGESTRDSVQRWRDTDAREAALRERVCAALNISDAAVAYEGFLVYSPQPALLSSALATAIDADQGTAVETRWRFVTDQSESIDGLLRQGAIACHSRDVAQMPYQYIGLKRG